MGSKSLFKPESFTVAVSLNCEVQQQQESPVSPGLLPHTFNTETSAVGCRPARDLLRRSGLFTFARFHGLNVLLNVLLSDPHMWNILHVYESGWKDSINMMESWLNKKQHKRAKILIHNTHENMDLQFSRHTPVYLEQQPSS